MCKIGGYDKEEKAARAYDLAALKYWGPTTHINFPVFIISLSFVGKQSPVLWHSCILLYLCTIQLSTYEKELEEMKNMTRQEFVAHLRRLVPKHSLNYKL